MPKRSDFLGNFFESASRTSQAVGAQSATDAARQMLAEMLSLPDKEKERAIQDLKMQGEKQRQTHEAELLPLQKRKLAAEAGASEALETERRADAKKKSGEITHDKLVEEKTISAILANPAVFDQLAAPDRLKYLPTLVERGFKYQGQPASAETVKLSENAKSGLRAILKVRQELGTGIKSTAKQVLRALPGSPGARTLEAARKEVADVYTRIRTGAALNDREISFYDSQLPSVLDSAESTEYKLSLFENLFKSLAVQQNKGTAYVTGKQEQKTGSDSSSQAMPGGQFDDIYKKHGLIP